MGRACGPSCRSHACVGRREETELSKEKPWTVLSSKSISIVFTKSPRLRAPCPAGMGLQCHWPPLLSKARNIWKWSVFMATEIRR